MLHSNLQNIRTLPKPYTLRMNILKFFHITKKKSKRLYIDADHALSRDGGSENVKGR